MPDLFTVPADACFSLVFVDGCKSWYGTRFFLERIRHAMPAGTLVAMQDFGWYTCFWLSALVGLLPEHFRLVAYHHHTYAFELVKAISEGDLARFPDHPGELGGGTIDDLFEGLRQWAWSIDDSWAMLSLDLQHAAALAYAGYREEARRRIGALGERAEFARSTGPAHLPRVGALSMIRNARRSPTYYPDRPLKL